jgi:hypothetical protein
MNNLDPASKKHLIETLTRVDPRSAVRLLSVLPSKNKKQVLSRIDTLKRVVRRRVSRMRHGPRINENLLKEKFEAYRRGRMTPEARRTAINKHVKRMVPLAYYQYQIAQPGNRNAMWNRFVRIHLKSGGQPITKNQARERFRHV